MTTSTAALYKDAARWQEVAAQGPVSNLVTLTHQQIASSHPQSTPLSAGNEIDSTTSLLERTQDLRNWLRKAKTEYKSFSRSAPAPQEYE